MAPKCFQMLTCSRIPDLNEICFISRHLGMGLKNRNDPLDSEASLPETVHLLKWWSLGYGRNVRWWLHDHWPGQVSVDDALSVLSCPWISPLVTTRSSPIDWSILFKLTFDNTAILSTRESVFIIMRDAHTGDTLLMTTTGVKKDGFRILKDNKPWSISIEESSLLTFDATWRWSLPACSS